MLPTHPETCSLFWQQKREPEKTAATSEARGTAKGLLAPWNPKDEGRGRAGLKNRQDTFFDAPPTHSRLTAPPKISPPGRGGACPARGQMMARKLRVSPCNPPNNAILRVNRTGRIYASPTNLPKMGVLSITSCLPVICREGSRPLLAALWQPPIKITTIR